MVKHIAEALALLAVIALLAGSWRTNARTSAESAARADSIATLSAAVDTLRAESAKADSLAQLAADSLALAKAEADALRDRARDRGTEAQTRAVSAGESFTASMDSLRTSVPPPLVPLVDRAEEQAEERDRQRLVQIQAAQDETAGWIIEAAGLERALDTRTRAWAASRETVRGLTEQLEMTERDRDYWQKEASRRDWGGWIKAAAIGAAVGAVLAR